MFRTMSLVLATPFVTSFILLDTPFEMLKLYCRRFE